MQSPVIIFSTLLLWYSSDIWVGKSGKVTLESDAPLELIEASTKEIRGAINVSDNTFAFTVDAGSLKGFNSPLQQEHFHENYLQSDQFPTANFTGRFIENISTYQSGNYQVRTKGKLKIHGVEAERIIKCQIQITEEEIVLTSQFLVPLADHNIRVPQVVYQKIAEEISITVTIALSPR